MLEIADWTSFVIGITSGVIASYAIYATYYLIGNEYSKRKLDDFFGKIGVLKGSTYYEKVTEGCGNEEYKEKLRLETEEYLKHVVEHEQKLDMIFKEYMEQELSVKKDTEKE